MQPDPILFLDIDGVLNNRRFWKSSFRKPLSRQCDEAYYQWQLAGRPRNGNVRDVYCNLQGLTDIDPRNVKHLNDLAERTCARIVVSSTWRKSFTLEELRNLLSQRGLRQPQRVISVTGILWGGFDYTPDQTGHIQRGMEIEQWLLTHLPRAEMLETPFIILDDHSDFGRLRAVHLRTASSTGGFHDKHVRKALRMLGRQAAKPAGGILRTPNRHWYPEERRTYYPDLGCPDVQEMAPCKECGTVTRHHKMSCASGG